ncbi:MAG TPA: hypothetical protein VJI97_00565 [Candidatus Nanoarchaeia archaeon]|nr:hypothetical protein [Candidatus Nanoarchaeia archaeon]
MKKTASLVMLLVFLAGCASITQQEAELRAAEFVKSNVKFFAKDRESDIDLPQYSVEKTDSYQESGNWVVVMHISSQINGTEKKNDLTVKFDRKGNIIEFNGRKLA